MSETATRQLVNALNDPEEPLTPEVEEAAKGVSGVIKNVLKSSSGVNQALGSTSSKVCLCRSSTRAGSAFAVSF